MIENSNITAIQSVNNIELLKRYIIRVIESKKSKPATKLQMRNQISDLIFNDFVGAENAMLDLEIALNELVSQGILKKETINRDISLFEKGAKHL